MIISNNEGGLSNRIKSLVSCIRIAKKNNIDHKVYWPILDSYKYKSHILNCGFSNLFKNEVEIEDISNIEKKYIFNSHCLYIDDIDNLPKNFNNFKSNCAIRFSKHDKYDRNIDFMYNKIPLDLREEYIKYFNELKPIEELQKEINNFSKKFDNNTISVHIRSWNRKNEIGRRDYLYNIGKFEKEMEKYDNTYNFYIASDSQEVLDYFQKSKKFSKRILIYPRKTDLDTSRDFQEGVQEDLIELYLLSKNKIIIGSHFSTYTEVSWWLSSCTENIIIL